MKGTLNLQSMGFMKVENNRFGERYEAMKVISLAGITCECETEILILTMYLKVSKNV